MNATLLVIATTRRRIIVFMKNVVKTSADASHAAISISMPPPSADHVCPTIQTRFGGGKFSVRLETRP
jgi:hypothetical protein